VHPNANFTENWRFNASSVKEIRNNSLLAKRIEQIQRISTNNTPNAKENKQKNPSLSFQHKEQATYRQSHYFTPSPFTSYGYYLGFLTCTLLRFHFTIFKYT